MSTPTIRPKRQRARLAEMPEMMTVAEAAGVCGCSQSAYYAGIQLGSVPFVRLSPGRVGVPREMLRRWLRGDYQTPAQVRAASVPLRIAR
jgi:hypothetical protein